MNPAVASHGFRKDADLFSRWKNPYEKKKEMPVIISEQTKFIAPKNNLFLCCLFPILVLMSDMGK